MHERRTRIIEPHASFATLSADMTKVAGVHVPPPSLASGATGVQRLGLPGYPPAIRVSTQGHLEDVGVRTLVGDYAEVGSNHSRKTYRKLSKIPGFEDVHVYLYYWDMRDGPDFAGWWFGDQVGGEKVWARCPNHEPSPPRIGWKIPWYSERAESGQLLVDEVPCVLPGMGGWHARAGADTGIAGCPGHTACPVAASYPGARGPAMVHPPARPPGLCPALERPAKPAAPHGFRQCQASSAPQGAAVTANAQSAAEAVAGGVKLSWQKVEVGEKRVGAAEERVKDVLAEANDALAAGSASDILEAILKRLADLHAQLSDEMRMLTANIASAKTLGALGKAPVAGFAKLTPRVWQLQASISSRISSVANQTMRTKQKESDTATEREQDIVDSAAFREALPPVSEAVIACEDEVDNVATIARPLIDDPPEADALESSMGEIEALFVEVQRRIDDTRESINSSLQDSKSYALTTQKHALAAFTSLQARLSDAQNKLNPYKTFRQDFKSLLEAKEKLVGFSEKISEAEVEVEKVVLMMRDGGEEMSEEEICAAAEAARVAQAGLLAATRIVDAKLRELSAGPARDDFAALKDRSNVARGRVESMLATFKRRTEVIAAGHFLVDARQKVARAEEAVSSCLDAEEDLLQDQASPETSDAAIQTTRALEKCEEAARRAQMPVHQAATFCKTKLMHLKAYAKEAQDQVGIEFKQLQENADAAAVRLKAFKAEILEQKLSPVMKEVTDAVNHMEERAACLKQKAGFIVDGDVEELDGAKLKQAVESAEVIIKEADNGFYEAQRMISKKQSDAPKRRDVRAAMSKLQDRLNAAKAEVAKCKKLMSAAERFLTGSLALIEETARIDMTEAAMNVAERRSQTGYLTDAAIIDMNATLVESIKVVQSALASCERHKESGSATIDSKLVKIVERCGMITGRVDNLKTLTRERRESVLSKMYIQDAAQAVQIMEASLEKLNEAEIPLIEGMAVLAIAETLKIIEDSDACATATQSFVTEARAVIAAKSLEVMQFDEAAAIPATDAFNRLSDRVASTAAKLATLQMDSERRKKDIQILEAGEIVNNLEVEVSKLADRVEPFRSEIAAEDARRKSVAEASDECAKLYEEEGAVQALMDKTNVFLEKARKRSKEPADLEALEHLRRRAKQARVELRRVRTVVGDYEQAFVAKKLLAEAERMLQAAEGSIVSSREACRVLMEDGGVEFLVAASVARLGDGIRKHMEERALSSEEVFLEWTSGKARRLLGEEDFLSNLDTLPVMLGDDALTFPKERQPLMFARVATGLPREVGLEQFRIMLEKRYVVLQPVTFTDDVSISKGKTVAKLQTGDILEVLGMPRRDEASKMDRVHMRAPSGKEGWVTLHGSGGTQFLQEHTDFQVFIQKIAGALKTSAERVAKVSVFLQKKSEGLAQQGPGPLFKAMQQLEKMRPRAVAAQSGLDALKKKVQSAKAEFERTALQEKNAHLVIKERMLADSLVGDLCGRIEAIESAQIELEVFAAPLSKLEGVELAELKEPITVLDRCRQLLNSIEQRVLDIHWQVKEKQQCDELKNPMDGPLSEVKGQLSKMRARADTEDRKAKALFAVVKKACHSLAVLKVVKVSSVLRSVLVKRGISVYKLFAEIAGVGEVMIREPAFAANLTQLGLTLEKQHTQLLFRHLVPSGDGLSKQRFASFVQKFYVVAKPIALTDSFEISQTKTIRKTEVEEIIEVLEGPRTDESAGLVRVRGRLLSDGVTGWITVKGNHGTSFLQQVEKPFYVCNADVALEVDASGTELVRKLRAEEVLELLEGPRKDTKAQDALRAQGKATKDDKTGWFTVKDRSGTIFAVPCHRSYVCMSSVAVTDSLHVSDCKVLRKLQVGETFMSDGEPVLEYSTNITRLKGTCPKDNLVGWVTLRGNAGTVYISPSTNHYTVSRDVPLHRSFKSENAEVLRHLRFGEALEVLSGPKVEVLKLAARVRVRVLGDGAQGWVTLHADTVQAWMPVYRCLMVTPLHVARDPTEGDVIRDLVRDEKVEFLEGPVECGEAMRMRGRAEKDGVVGWMTLRDAEGRVRFKC